jgi:transcriptional regulator with XRE-family HTH domain
VKDINEIVRINLLKRRREKGLTQEKLALKTSLHRAYIGQVERGEKKIGLTNLQKIADALEIEITEFLVK